MHNLLRCFVLSKLAVNTVVRMATGDSSEAVRLMINSAMEDSIGDS